MQARLASGASLLLTDATPLTDQLLGAVSFYVWADLEPGDLYGADEPGPGEVSSGAWARTEPALGVATSSVAVSQLKDLLGAERQLLSAAVGR